MGLTSGEYVKAAVDGRVAVLTIEHRPVNALNRKTLEELGALVDAVRDEADIKVVILTGGGSLAFVAGADIKEIAKLESVAAAQAMSTPNQE